MRRLLTVLIVCSVLFSLAGCGYKNKKTDCCSYSDSSVNDCCGQESSLSDFPDDIPDCCG